MGNNPCVYSLSCSDNYKIYIGSTINFNARKNSHISKLRLGKHPNSHLQNAFNKYGESSFFFDIVEECTADNLLEREQFWITFLDVSNPQKGMNNSPTATNKLGFRHSEQTKLKLSNIAKNRGHSHLIALAISQKGTKLGPRGKSTFKWSAEEKKRMSLQRKGMQAWNKGIPTPDETKQKISRGVRKVLVSKYTSEDISMVIELRQQGLSWPAIANKTGLPLSTAYKLGTLRTYEKKAGVTK